MTSSFRTKHIAYAAIVGAMSFVIMRLTQIPIFAAAPYLKLELSEAPLLLLAVLVSPMTGLIALLVKDVLGIFFSGYNVFGVSADIIMTGIFVFVFARLLRGGVTLPKALIATGIASLARMLLSIPVNLLVLWLEFGTPAAGVFAMMPYILPFNLIKCCVNALIFYLLYPRLNKLMVR